MKVQFTKRKDGGAVVRCVRADGSATWQRQDDQRAAFFPLHDLTHYAVETELGYGRGFYGLIASGWDIADTTGKGPRGPTVYEGRLSQEAAKKLVGTAQTALARGGSGKIWLDVEGGLVHTGPHDFVGNPALRFGSSQPAA